MGIIEIFLTLNLIASPADINLSDLPPGKEQQIQNLWKQIEKTRPDHPQYEKVINQFQIIMADQLEG